MTKTRRRCWGTPKYWASSTRHAAAGPQPVFVWRAQGCVRTHKPGEETTEGVVMSAEPSEDVLGKDPGWPDRLDRLREVQREVPLPPRKESLNPNIEKAWYGGPPTTRWHFPLYLDCP
jgi:hypothetical protein